MFILDILDALGSLLDVLQFFAWIGDIVCSVPAVAKKTVVEKPTNEHA
jgi:hypothetical protein